ncbi:MAG: PQQ-like beta-propeller repeat protein [Gemmataceae bacterium]|nr:PQQ-like beta-propeller repeat protein [Gemmataceae bacterium]
MRRLLPLVILGAIATPVLADDWPQWFGPKRDGVWRETGIIEKFPEGGPKVKWRVPIGAGYAGPAVAGGKVFVQDRVLDKGAVIGDNPFKKDAVNGKDRILCLEEATGKELWKHEYPSKYEISYASGPRATPVIADGKVYAQGSMGELFCLDASSGKVIWSKNFPKDYEASVPMWGWAASPLLDGDKLICLVGGKDSVAVAFNKDTGKEVWKSLSAKEPGYCPPVIFEVGGKRQLIIWHPEAINGLDPDTGKVFWTQPFNVKAGLSIPTPRVDGDKLFVTSFYNGSMMLKFDGKKAEPVVLWKGKSNSEQPRNTDGLHAIMVTPTIKDGMIYGVCSYGELRGLKEDTGERVWESGKLTGSTKQGKDRWNNAFIVPQGDRFFFFTEQGDLVIGKLTPKGYEEISRANILKPDNKMASGRPVVWSHPAFANKSAFARNDSEIVCVSLAAE